MLVELRHNSLLVDCELPLPIKYREQRMPGILRVDLLVEGCVVVELKSIEVIHPVHVAQVITYLKLSGHPIGLLTNFNVTSLRKGLRRVDHPDLHGCRQRPLINA